MRQYFFNLLKNLDKLSGMKQYEKLCQMPNAKDEINVLLDILCRVTDQFTMIPDVSKKQIIDEAVIADPEFIGLNAKFIAKSLNMKKEFYLNQKDDVVIHPDALTGEARDKKIAELLEAINKCDSNFTERVSRFDDIRSRQLKQTDGEGYKQNDDAVDKHLRHVEYVKQNYDPRTGKPLPTWIPEDDFNKTYDNLTT